jgi:hypothetical protein
MLEYMGMFMAELHSSDSASPAQAHIITNWSLIDAVSGNAQVYGHVHGCAALLKFSLTSTSTRSTLSDASIQFGHKRSILFIDFTPSN